MKKMVLAAAAATLTTSVMAVAPARAAVTVFEEDFQNTNANNVTTGTFGKFSAQGNVVIRQGSQLATDGNSATGAARSNYYAVFGRTATGAPPAGQILAATIAGVADVATRYTLTFSAGLLGTTPSTQYLYVAATQESGDVLSQRVPLLANIPMGGTRNLNTALTSYTYTFDAFGPISLSFFGGGVDNDRTTTLLDDVSLTAAAVPEASTWIMMILGFGIVGSSIRGTRRRSIANLVNS